MVRSAAAILAVLILPEIALAQQAQGDHTVVNGDTLWDLAQQYYGDPFDWRRIWTANQANIADPNLIVPGQVLVIPGTAPSVGVRKSWRRAVPPSLRACETSPRSSARTPRSFVVA
ncbi:MAG: LysM peptidoglycan-binding domain-containing protein [Gemmatimonadota bacterium]|nr:LysM peptidoglycan-binding domain-containing protein [Gemmatimonadota bacterium]